MLCSVSRRKSKNLYLRRVSSGKSGSSKICNGSSSEAPNTSMSLIKISTSPVGNFLLTNSGARALTTPSILIHHSDLTFSRSLNTGLSGSAKICVIP